MSRVKDAILHFLTGKTFSALAGFLTTILFARELVPAAYAAYAVMLGLSEITGMTSSLALHITAQRFIPELRVREQSMLLVRLISGILTVRILALAIAVWVLFLISPWVAQVFSLTDWIQELRLWALAVLSMVSFHFISILLEALLLQRIVKWLWMTVSALRLTLVLTAIIVGEALSLKQVVWIEVAAYGAGSIFSAISLVIWLRDSLHKEEIGDKNPNLWLRILNFSLLNYLRELMFLFSGHASNRLVVAKFLIPSQIATFGFAQSLSNIVKRYMPSFLLSNMINPVLMARFSEDNDHLELNRMANLIFKLNCFFLAPILIWIGLMGNHITDLLSKGKYPDAGWILLVLIGLLFVGNHSSILEVHLRAAEKNRSLFISSFISALFLIPAVLLVAWLGIAGLLLSRFFGVLFRDAFLVITLRRKGFPYSLDISGLFRLVISAIMPFLLLLMLIPEKAGFVHISFFGIASGVLFLLAAFFFKPFSARENEIINNLIGRKLFIW